VNGGRGPVENAGEAWLRRHFFIGAGGMLHMRDVSARIESNDNESSAAAALAAARAPSNNKQ